MESVNPDMEPLKDQHIDDRVLALGVILSMVFFMLVSEALRWASHRYVILEKTSQWRWRNLAVSWIHADFCAVGCLYNCAMYGHHVQSLVDIMDLQPPSAFLLVAFSLGYFMYDFVDHWWNGQMKASWEVIGHHIFVIAIFAYNLVNHFCIAFSVLALIVEANSVFLHARKLMQMLQVPFSHWLYRLTSTFNLASFLVFRGLPMVVIWAGILLHSDRMSGLYTIMLSTVMVFMVIMNVILFWRLLKNDVLRRKKQWRRKEDSGRKTGQENGGTVCVDSVGGQRRGSDSVLEQNGSLPNGGLNSGVGPEGESVVVRGGESFPCGRSGGHDILNRSKAS